MKRYLVIGIVLFGFLLRVVNLSSHPAGFTPDEASFGYDAYSILKTGRDQWDNFMPLVFKSFGDDKLPVYTYLTVPSVAVFGLNEFAVRLPNALLGVAAIFVSYLLVKELFKSESLAFISSFLLAVSPWHVMLSRGAFEANLTTFFLPLGILMFLKSFKNKKMMWFSFLIFLINIFTYHTARLLTPFVLLGLIYFYRKELRSAGIIKTYVVFFVAILLTSIVGLFIGGSRISTSSIFSIDYSSDRYFAQVVGEPSIVSKIFYNRFIYVIRQFLGNYFAYFSPQFLFTNGPAEGTYGMIPGVGILYFGEIFFIAGFIWKIVKEKSREINLLIFWILISPVPAALTKGPGYAANRVSFVIPALQIILGVGAIYLWNLTNIRKRIGKLIVFSFCILFFVNFIYVSEKYLVGQVANQSADMIYGMSQIVNDLKIVNTGKVVISKSISEPQIYVAFYTQMNPKVYQQYSKGWSLVNGWVDQQGQYTLGNFIFRNINYSVDGKLAGVVLVGKPRDFPAETKPNKQVNYPNLNPAYYEIINR